MGKPSESGAGYSISAALESGTKGNVADDSVIDTFCWIILKDDIVLYSGTGGMSGIHLTQNARYNVLAWANTPGLGLADALEMGPDALMDQVYSFSSRRADWNGLKIPASYSACEISPAELDELDGKSDGKICLPLRRLTAKVNLNIQYDEMLRTMFPSETQGGVNYGILVNSVSLGGLAQNVGLFRPEMNSRSASGGTVDQSDGTLTYSFYVPESLGGELLSGNASPSGKNYSAVLAAGADPSAFPYVEVSVTLSAYMVSSPFTKTYRFYLGANSTSNFDVLRNHEYNITLLLGYNGLDVNDTWKLDGEPSGLGGRSCGIQSCNKTHAAAGEKIVLTAFYEYDGGGNSAADFYLRQNGFALCTGADKAAWLGTGAAPGGFTRLDDDSCILECRECHHYYTGFPMAAGPERMDWLDGNLADGGPSGICCMWCGAKLFELGGSGDWELFNSCFGTFTGTNINCINQYTCDFEYTVPSTAQVGDVIRVYAVTRDGRAGGYIDITVSNEDGYPRFDTPLGDEMYVAQKTSLSAVRWAQGIYGTSPSFSYSVSAVNGSGVADSGVVGISPIDTKSISISAKKPGTFTVACTCNGKDAGSFTGTVSAPEIGYPGGLDISLTVGNNGVVTAYTTPVYLIQDSGEWVEYTSYDNDLYATCLGDPSGSLADNNGWIGINSYGVYLEHAYRSGVVSAGNLLPFRSPSTRLDLLRFTSPLLPGPHCDVPVYFDPKYAYLDMIMDYGTYYRYIARSGLYPAQPTTRFTTTQYWPDQFFPEDEFFAEHNGAAVPISNVLSVRMNGYSFIVLEPGSKRVYWRLKGTAPDSYQLDICSILVKQKYIGSITTSCDEDNNDSAKISIYGGFYAWQDSPVGAFTTVSDSDINHGTLQGFRVYVGCENLVKELFRINHSAVLPTQGVYDPDPESNIMNWNYYHSDRDDVYYSQAKHVYDDSDLSYIAVMARWASYYKIILLQTIETHGFDMEHYKSFNSPLFVPAPSPQTVSGVTWNKVSDNGSTAVWESADGLQICEFTYKSW